MSMQQRHKIVKEVSKWGEFREESGVAWRGFFLNKKHIFDGQGEEQISGGWGFF